jgi:hypothetical protein
MTYESEMRRVPMDHAPFHFFDLRSPWRCQSTLHLVTFDILSSSRAITNGKNNIILRYFRYTNCRLTPCRVLPLSSRSSLRLLTFGSIAAGLSFNKTIRPGGWTKRPFHLLGTHYVYRIRGNTSSMTRLINDSACSIILEGHYNSQKV